MEIRSYKEVAAELGLTPFEVYDAERRAFYKILLFMLDEVDCDFEALAETLDIPLDDLITSFLKLFFYIHPERKPAKQSHSEKSYISDVLESLEKHSGDAYEHCRYRRHTKTLTRRIRPFPEI